jgi:phage terminase large subunit
VAAPIELNLNYQPKQVEMRDALEKYKVVFVGGARGGGKSWFARATALEYALRFPGISIGLFRKHYPELEANHIDPLLTQHPFLVPYYKLARRVLEIPVGGVTSKVRFCHCGTQIDARKYQGSEFQLLIIDEAGEWTGDLITRLRASNRSSNPNIPVKMLLTGNPGGDGHAYLKRLFVDRDFQHPEKAEDYFFVPAFLSDNAALNEADPDYRSRLEQEPNEALRKAWLEGDWNLFEGRFFREFNDEIHICDDLDPFTDLKEWRKFTAMDWGFYHPAAVLWFAQNLDSGEVVVYREYLTREESPQSVKKKIYSYPDSAVCRWHIGPVDMWNRSRDGGPSVEEQFRLGEPKHFLVKANNDRRQGWAQIRAYLAYHRDEAENYQVGPKLKICRSCRLTIDGIKRLRHHKSKPEEVAEIMWHDNSRIGDGEDQADALRYGLMSLSPLTKKVAETTRGRQRWRDARPNRRVTSWITS